MDMSTGTALVVASSCGCRASSPSQMLVKPGVTIHLHRQFMFLFPWPWCLSMEGAHQRTLYSLRTEITAIIQEWEHFTRYVCSLGLKIIMCSHCYRSSFIFVRHYFPSLSYGLVYWSIYSVEMGLNSPESQSFLFCVEEAWYWCDRNPLLSALKGKDDSVWPFLNSFLLCLRL